MQLDLGHTPGALDHRPFHWRQHTGEVEPHPLADLRLLVTKLVQSAEKKGRRERKKVYVFVCASEQPPDASTGRVVEVEVAGMDEVEQVV